jgi:apolipoprotein N-acyltransferase
MSHFIHKIKFIFNANKPLKAILFYSFTLLLGMTANLAFPPHAISLLIFVTMTIFCYLLEKRGSESSFWYGYTFYLGAVIAFIGYWFSYYFRLQLGCGYLLSYLLTSIICFYTSLYIGIIALIYSRLKTRWQWFNLILLLPSLWVITELVRGWFFPRSWYALGYTQVNNPLLRGWFPLLGVYSVSWIILAIAGYTTYFLHHVSKKNIIKMGSGIFIFLICSALLGQIHYTKPEGKPLTIALLQPSIFSSKNYTIQTLYEIETASTELLTATHADIFVLPETVFGTNYHSLTPGYLDQLKTIANINNAEILFGSSIHINQDTKYTGTLKLSDLENPVYVKHNLVPFGEYNPLKDTFMEPLVSAVTDQLSSYSAGTNTQEPALIKGQKFAFNICYENTINDFVANSAKDATIILNQSDLSWYGETGMKDDFLQFSQGRALETQRYFLQDGNTGDTAVINPYGVIESSIAPFVAGTLVSEVKGYSGITPFQVVGNYPVWIISLLIVFIMILTKIIELRQLIVSKNKTTSRNKQHLKSGGKNAKTRRNSK